MGDWWRLGGMFGILLGRCLGQVWEVLGGTVRGLQIVVVKALKG